MATEVRHDLRDQSLAQSLREGSAGVGVRLLASVGAALLLLGAASILAYLWGALFPPPWTKAIAGRGVWVPGEGAVVVFFFCGVAWIFLVCWIWTRRLCRRTVLRARMPIGLWALGVGLTAAVGVPAVLISVVLAEVPGDSEFLCAAVICAAGGLIPFIWIRLYRQAGGRAVHDAAGVIDLRCPECGYSMMGLKQARCPECGREYTLDELISRQNFEALRPHTPSWRSDPREPQEVGVTHRA